MPNYIIELLSVRGAISAASWQAQNDQLRGTPVPKPVEIWKNEGNCVNEFTLRAIYGLIREIEDYGLTTRALSHGLTL